jgi:hypothetical protein
LRFALPELCTTGLRVRLSHVRVAVYVVQPDESNVSRGQEYQLVPLTVEDDEAEEMVVDVTTAEESGVVTFARDDETEEVGLDMDMDMPTAEERGVVAFARDDETGEVGLDVATAEESGVVTFARDDETGEVGLDVATAEESGVVTFVGLWTSKNMPAMGWVKLLDDM